MKQIVIDDQLHGQVKAAAALRGETLREFAERALRAALPTEPLLPFGNDNGSDARKEREA